MVSVVPTRLFLGCYDATFVGVQLLVVFLNVKNSCKVERKCHIKLEPGDCPRIIIVDARNYEDPN